VLKVSNSAKEKILEVLSSEKQDDAFVRIYLSGIG